MIVTRILYAAVTVFLIGGGAQARGSYHTEDRYNPHHILDLPPEVRASIAHQCDVPRALHDFAAYSDHDRIVLHYEHFYCQGRDVFCNASGCLHQVYVLSGGRYRLQRSYYAPN
jgi:hypothetical protein